MAGPSITRSIGSLLHQSYRRSFPTAVQHAHRSIATTSVLRNDKFFGGFPQRSSGPVDFNAVAKILDSPSDNYLLHGGPPTIEVSEKGTHSLHVYAHRHNTHITFTHTPKTLEKQPDAADTLNPLSQVHVNRQSKTLLTLSTGNIGFKKGGRGSYDAAYQLAAYAFKYIQEKGMLAEVESIAVYLRGYGSGRDAVSKAIMGTEGRYLRNYITTVVDTTRLKQGGTRGKKPRRLG